MKKGISLLNSLSLKNKEFEKILEIKEFPMFFRIFLQNYEVGDRMLQNEMLFINGNFEIFLKFQMFDNHLLFSENYNATIDKILDYEDLYLEFDNFTKKKENWHELGLLKIGYLFYGDILLIGMEENNKDEIWRYGNGILSEITCKLDDNIFDFFNRLKISVDTDLLDEWNIKESQIFKNYGESFWRIKEELK